MTRCLEAGVDRRGVSGPVSRIPIASAECLQELLADIREDHDSDGEAAEVLGLTRSTFRNLLKGRVTDAMSYETFASIVKALGGEPRPFGRVQAPIPVELEEAPRSDDDPSAVFRRELAKRRGEHPDDSRQGRKWTALEAHHLFKRFMGCVVTDNLSMLWGLYEEWMKRELARFRPLAEPVFEDIRRLPEYQERIRGFLRDTDRKWRGDELPADTDIRWWLALYRALAPLGHAEGALGVERTWQDLHEADELDSFLKAALKREAILLTPSTDLERARRGEVTWDELERQWAAEAIAEERLYWYWLRSESFRQYDEGYALLFRVLWKLPRYRKIFEEHLLEITGQPALPRDEKHREWLSILRPLDPLAPDTRGVERSWRELHDDDQLGTFLRQALSNERIMLDREDAKVRTEKRRLEERAHDKEFWGSFLEQEETGEG